MKIAKSQRIKRRKVSNMKKSVGIAAACIVIVAVIAIVAVLISALSEPTATPNTEPSQSANIVYDDEQMSIEFIKISNSLIEGNFEIYIKAENKTDKPVTVYLKDVSLNGSMVSVGSGVPCDILAGKNRTHSFFGRLDLAGLNSADEITNITFKVILADENFNTIKTTKDLEITF